MRVICPKFAAPRSLTGLRNAGVFGHVVGLEPQLERGAAREPVIFDRLTSSRRCPGPVTEFRGAYRIARRSSTKAARFR